MKKIDKIKRKLNKWKDVVCDLNEKKFFITWYTKYFLVWYTERPCKLPIKQVKILKNIL
jgi:hypothetical protein